MYVNTYELLTYAWSSRSRMLLLSSRHYKYFSILTGNNSFRWLALLVVKISEWTTRRPSEQYNEVFVHSLVERSRFPFCVFVFKSSSHIKYSVAYNYIHVLWTSPLSRYNALSLQGSAKNLQDWSRCSSLLK
jgi:hypothetical protein